jgi:hypothetical protein
MHLVSAAATDVIVDLNCLSYFANYSQQCALGRNETSGADASTCTTLFSRQCSRICGATCSGDSVSYYDGRLICSYADTSCSFLSPGGGVTDAGPASAADSPDTTTAGDTSSTNGVTPDDTSDPSGDSSEADDGNGGTATTSGGGSTDGEDPTNEAVVDEP